MIMTMVKTKEKNYTVFNVTMPFVGRKEAGGCGIQDMPVLQRETGSG